MRIAASALVLLNGLIHTYIAWFEIFAWETRGPKVFSAFPTELFAQTVEMAANQGIYNFFLAVGLFWSLTIKDRDWRKNVAVCFLIFVAAAGIFGAITVTPKTLMVQTVPAILAIAAVLVSFKSSQNA